MTLLGTTRLTVRLSLGAAALVALAACGGGSTDAAAPSQESSSDPTTDPSESPSVPAPTATATPTAEPRLIGYAGGESPGVEVHDRADAKKLDGAPASFKAFIGRIAQRITDTSDCDAAAKGVTVETLRTDGYAVGGVNDCGGYAALWAEVDGRWKQILGTQDSWECAVLQQYSVPSDIVGTTCYDYDAQKEHDYHQR